MGVARDPHHRCIYLSTIVNVSVCFLYTATGWTVALVLGGTVALLLPIVFILSIFVIITTHKRRRSVDFRSDGELPSCK